jgi:hypothetical protein
VSTARLDQFPLFVGFDWSVSLSFPTGYLQAGDAIRGQFRVTDHHELGYELTVVRDADLVSLSLPGTVTKYLQEKDHHVDLVKVDVSGYETPLGVRLVVPVQVISTRPDDG